MRIPAVTMFTKLLRFILVFNCPLSTYKLINCGLQESSKAPGESSKAPGAFSVSHLNSVPASLLSMHNRFRYRRNLVALSIGLLSATHRVR